MKIIFVIVVMLLIFGCQPFQDHAIYNQAKYNFVYESDKENELRLYERVDKKFYGDCEDFAFTLQKQIGGDVWYVILNDKSYTQAHAVLVKDGVVYDYLYKKSRVDDYPASFLFMLKR
jgi:hypothetical protein